MRMMPPSLPVASRLRQKTAHLRTVGCFVFSGWQNCSNVTAGRLRSSLRRPDFFCTRYTFPGWSAFSPSRPATEICRHVRQKRYAIGYHATFAIDCLCGRITGDAHETTRIGSGLCKRHQSSSQQWPYLAWRVVSTMTWNAAWLVQGRGLLPLNCLAQTAQAPWLLAQPQACFATTRASQPAANLDARAFRGRINSGNRQRGSSPLAVFSF